MDADIQVGQEFKLQFRRLEKKYHSLRQDFKEWKDELAKNPFMGVDLGDGVRKIRMAIASKGREESGGARIITFNVRVSDDGLKIILLTIYDKGEISSIKDDFIKGLVQSYEFND